MNLLNNVRTSDYEYYKRDGEAENRARRMDPHEELPNVNQPEKVARALRKFSVTADSLFTRIRDDLDRGLVREARAHLDFVDVLLQTP